MLLFHKQYSSEGPPLIILHGLFGHQGNWAGHARVLSESFAVFGFDARNHGQSRHADSMTYPEMAADVAETMDELGISQAAFIGHSMGGKTAMQLALTDPQRVSRLLVVDIAPVAYMSGPDKVLSALLEVDLDRIENRREADSILEKSISSKAVRDFLLTNLRQVDGRLQWRMNLPVINASHTALRAGLESEHPFTGPTLFIKGEHSDYLMPAYKPQTLALFPKATIVEVKGAAHWVHSEKPERFLQLARDFLTD